jgi:prophage antirepressor-like protein
MSPTPKKDDGWTCSGCNSWNESSRTRCRNCQSGTSEITPFAFPATGQPVRTVTVDGQPWFVAADVCAVLSIGRPQDSVRYLDEDERGRCSVDTPSGEQNMLTVNEPGLYSLILRSRKSEARAFKRWITHEVLPAIRSTGSYTAAPQFEIPRTLGEALRLAASQADEIERQRLQLATAEPKAEAWDVLASADPDWSVREAAFILNRDPAIDTGQQRLFNELRRMKVIDSRDIPYASHARHVKLRPRTFTNRATNEEMPAKPQVRITAEGLAYLHKRMGGSEPLELREPVS